MSLALIAALPFLGAALPALMIRSGRDASALSAGAVTALALLMLALHAPAVLSGEVVTTRIDWMPALGLNANFFLDGLGLLFAGLILGIGLLIILYARFYLSPRDPMGQFYSYLLLFQGAMLGIVLSDNILLLLVFWELTSLSSFLLIGYWKHLPAGRQGARMALTVTGMGGLSMIAGMLILGGIAGSYDLTVILQSREAIQASEWYLTALVLILIGCFTKSAQFPFHFWLPHAMAAPTPVSAYLHSATMVKAGLFLMARMWPTLAGTPEWFYLVATTGLVTMVMAAKIALFKDDLKALLAFSTVSHLGLVTMLLGFGTTAAATAAIFHIINHATFKAALFMVAGIVDHEAHTRDLKRLGGLRKLMPVTFAIATVATLSMAGIPPLNGFLSKEMMLEEASHTLWAGEAWLMPVFATLGALFSVAYSFRFLAHAFLGPVRDDYPHRPHDPGFGMWAAPAVLVLLVLGIGLAPMAAAGWLVDAAAGATTGEAVHAHIAHWHGLTPALWMSVAAVGGGLVLLGLHGPLMRAWLATPRPEAKRIFDGLIEPLASAAAVASARLHDGALTRYFAIAVTAIVAGGGAAFLSGSHLPGLRTLTPVDVVPTVGWVLLVVATVALVLRHHDRLLALILVGVVGLVVSMGFAYLSAPDLALTQILVEVATVMLLLLALNFLPGHSPAESRRGRRLRDVAISVAGGLGAGGLIYALMTRDAAFSSIAGYHLANAKTGGGGTNVVNVILVDFRGYDTFGEITVLGIAALVIFAITETILRAGPANDRLLAWAKGHRKGGDRHPLLLVVATRMMLPVALMVGIFIFLRGHNLPGGGFIAGLVVAIAALMQYMASGFGWSAARKRVEYHALIACGVLVAAGAGVGSWFAGRPFLTSAYGYVHLPPLEEFELATAMIFDTGVFLAVLGAVMLALASISRIAVRAGEEVASAPYDIDLPRDGFGER
ncbi:monovalent cation/H+ antiporter subunit A [Cereibacter sphaeroides]|uniref:monovalent cation/H+ antiporter subunit A n=1 Tax=Cereibacter sphaeroides TaxID=1063 RepID=UPI001F318B21|nr:monovalent cation/H+ antiporter subunit A [Cereibacter sphaeroides]MCE6958890.1 monovalent cation/H+ antiporter subunit A [Cereibacter sphaeroides]MCE6968879.1 monovalent cation/H+ antiporter subunit A [Cereibacter sphaeroides]MCE6973528.1 monovalent cation/H+ antiporter subunit A [Cereibacter sphaeroides]